MFPGIGYRVTVVSTALSTTNDSITIIAAATRPLLIASVKIGGMGTASAANEIKLARSTAGTTGGGALTPAPLNPSHAAAACTVYTTWSAQPTLGVVLSRLNVNANGGIDMFRALNGAECIYIPGSGQFSIRSDSGTSNVNLAIQLFEL